MKKHSGMRPQDIVILLKIAVLEDEHWYGKDLAFSLNISQSEVSESLNRSKIAGLLSSDKKKLMKQALAEFLEFGLKYVYPQLPGAIVRGLPTAHSAPPLKRLIQNKDEYVWPYEYGTVRGQKIEPLHPGVPEACLRDEKLYYLLAMADAIRVGKAREKELAIEKIKIILNH